MTKLPLTFACWNYDRTRSLLEGRTPIDGIELNYLDLPVEETFFRMLRHREFDVAEMSLSSYTVSLSRENPPFIAIPIFPSRFFRHSCIYVHADSGITRPEELKGKRIGTPEFQMTAPVWIRGIMSDDYGVKVTDARYFTGGEEQPGRDEKLKLNLPPSISVTPIGPEQTLARMIESGEVDALYTARAPSTYRDGQGQVRRLFPAYHQVERAYYERTRIFPIMHTVVIRREVYEANRWVARSLMKAFEAAQQEVYNDLRESAALKYMLPWLLHHVEETEALMGRDFWPYGLDANRPTLETFLRYHHEQGLSPRRLRPEDLFAPETLESFKI